MSVDSPRTILVDTNVWLDNYLPDRPHAAYSRDFIDEALRRDITLVYSATSIKDIFYIVESEFKRIVRGEKGALTEEGALAIKQIAWGVVDNINEVASPVGVDLSDIWLASKWRTIDRDLEDNLVRAAAQRAKVDLVVTWDKGMLAKAFVPTVTPADACAQLAL